MKSVHLAVLVLIVYISAGEALKCNLCDANSKGKQCRPSVQTCRQEQDVCTIVVHKLPSMSEMFSSSGYTYGKSCMRSADAFLLQSVAGAEVFTCSTDLCN